jgi:proteasome accessory factor C
MAKQSSTPVDKAARLLDLVPFISTHQGIAIADLAKEFELSETELLSDLNTLWMCGLPGYTPLELIDLEFESGYVSIRNAEILQRVRLLTKEELVIILLGLDILRGSFTEERLDLKDAVESLIAKIKKIVGDVATAAPIVDSTHRAVIAQGLQSRRDLEIVYHSTIRDAVTTRTITPLDISVDFGFEVLNAYCHTANGFRTFRLDNMKSVNIIAERSEIPKERTDSQFQWQVHISSRLRTTLERFRESPDQLPSEKQVTVAVKSFSRDWLLRSALSTLGSAEVKSPEDARLSIANSCQQTLDLYQANSSIK